VDADAVADVAPVLTSAGPLTVVHALAYGPARDQVAGGPDAPAVSVLACIQAIADRGGRDELLVLTTDAVWARPGDRVDARRAALTGLVRTAAIEGVPVRLLDVSGAAPGEVAAAVNAECCRARTDHGPDAVVARRGGSRLVARLRTIEPQSSADGIRAGGLYLLTGGLGGIGLELSAHLLAAYGARLLLFGRSPEAAVADRLAELRELGEVWYTAGDAADPSALVAAVSAAEKATGQPLDGVLHLAGASVAAYWDDPAAHTLDHESTVELSAMLHPKLSGVEALGQLLGDRPDALLVLFSSVNGLFGGRSFGAYAAANSALDGFADEWARGLGRPVRCIAWSIWSEVGMSRHAPSATVRLHGFRTLEISEGLLSLVEAIGQPEPYVVVGLDGANPAVQRMVDPAEFAGTELVIAVAPVDPDSDPTTLADAVQIALGEGRVMVLPSIPYTVDGQPDEQRILELASSPTRTTRYVEPQNELERAIARIWCEVLDLGRVGREDNFFAIGGNSLRVMKAMAQMNDLLGERHPARVLYDNPTPGELAGVVS
jgi:NAD(P)-dependent dehydrogenase (short-subunit alcohol dehydrogenase family)